MLLSDWKDMSLVSEQSFPPNACIQGQVQDYGIASPTNIQPMILHAGVVS